MFEFMFIWFVIVDLGVLSNLSTVWDIVEVIDETWDYFSLFFKPETQAKVSICSQVHLFSLSVILMWWMLFGNFHGSMGCRIGPLLVNAVNVNDVKRVSFFLCVPSVTVSALFPHSPSPGWDIPSCSLRYLVYSHLRLWIMQCVRCMHRFESLFAKSVLKSFVDHMVHLVCAF